MIQHPRDESTLFSAQITVVLVFVHSEREYTPNEKKMSDTRSLAGGVRKHDA